jgi:dTDP-4-amino-4,6-dideoxygalactose transaminase
MILTDNPEIATIARHLSTTAKRSHPWAYDHDSIGYNYRLPNINAAIGCAQMEILPDLLAKKRNLARRYRRFFDSIGVAFVSEPPGCTSNYWLNAILTENVEERDALLAHSHENGVKTRPIWSLISTLPMYSHAQTDELQHAKWLSERLVNIPSGVRP